MEKPRQLTMSGAAAKSKLKFLRAEAELGSCILRALLRGNQDSKRQQSSWKSSAAAQDERERKILHEESRVAAAKAPSEWLDEHAAKGIEKALREMALDKACKQRELQVKAELKIAAGEIA